MTWFANSGSQKVTSQGIEEEGEEETKFFIRERRRRSVPISFSGKRTLLTSPPFFPFFCNLKPGLRGGSGQRLSSQMEIIFLLEKYFFRVKKRAGRAQLLPVCPKCLTSQKIKKRSKKRKKRG